MMIDMRVVDVGDKTLTAVLPGDPIHKYEMSKDTVLLYQYGELIDPDDVAIDSLVKVTSNGHI